MREHEKVEPPVVVAPKSLSATPKENLQMYAKTASAVQVLDIEKEQEQEVDN